MIAFKWMVERKQEPPWGGIKQLNFPLLRASPTTSLNGKGHRTLQQNISETRCTTALGHDMLPGYPTKASLSLTWQEQQMGQIADQNQRGRSRERERRWWFSCRGKKCIPFKQKWDYVQGLGCLRPSTEEVGTWTECCWKDRQPLSNAQLHFTINANIMRQYLYAILSSRHILPHLILMTALCNR